LHKRNCELLNIPDESTFERSNTTNTSVIDLTFATPNLAPKILDWCISESFQTGSDHELIRFSMITGSTETVTSPIIQGLYNLKKADWTKFEQIIKERSTNLNELTDCANTDCTNTDCTNTDCTNTDYTGKLELIAIQLQSLISDAAEKTIPKLRLCAKSKP
jgi:hypothetical protein